MNRIEDVCTLRFRGVPTDYAAPPGRATIPVIPEGFIVRIRVSFGAVTSQMPVMMAPVQPRMSADDVVRVAASARAPARDQPAGLWSGSAGHPRTQPGKRTHTLVGGCDDGRFGVCVCSVTGSIIII